MDVANQVMLGQGGHVDIWSILWLIPAVILFVVALVAVQFFSLWPQAFMSQAGVSLVDLLVMRLRKVDPRTIVLAKSQLVKAGINEVTVRDLERHFLAGGRIPDVVDAMIDARRADMDLSRQEACEVDLAECDIDQNDNVGEPEGYRRIQ